MAKKKITDLQLIDAVDAGLNLAGDDTLQTYRLTAAQLKDFILPDAGLARGKLAPGAIGALNVVSKTAAYTALSTDDLILVDASAGAVTITLPTAVGISGRTYRVQKIDSSANAVTIDGAGTETISGSLTLALVRQWQQASVTSDNSNWISDVIVTPNAAVMFAFSDRINPSSGVTINFNEGIQTITFIGAGKFKITLNNSSSHSNTYTAARHVWQIGGTATRVDRFGPTITKDGIDAQDSNQYDTEVIYGTFTNGQTITLLPQVQCNYSAGTHTFTADFLLEYLP